MFSGPSYFVCRDNKEIRRDPEYVKELIVLMGGLGGKDQLILNVNEF